MECSTKVRPGRECKSDRIRSYIATNPELTNKQLGQVFGISEAAIRKHKRNLGNPKHRELFTIPKAKPSNSTALAVTEPPTMERVTGNDELDTCLWMARVLKTATDELTINKVLDAANRIKTPAKELEKIYSSFLASQGGDSFFAALGAFAVGEFKGKARAALDRVKQAKEGQGVFGSADEALKPMPPEKMLIDALGNEYHHEFMNKEQIAEDYKKLAPLTNPWTLSDCVRELQYWNWLYSIRAGLYVTAYPDDYSLDPIQEVQLREDYVRGLLTTIKPVDRAEAKHMASLITGDSLIHENEERVPILVNLVG